PGIEELVGMLSLLNQLESKDYDRVVVDLPGAAQTVRLLDAPLALRRLANLLKGAGEKPAKKSAPLPSIALDPLAARADRLLALLKDPARCAIHLTALAEPVPEAQTRVLFAQLRERGF